MQLDYAKRHLTHTITSLRRLAMLTAAVDDLEQVGELPASPQRGTASISSVVWHLGHMAGALGMLHPGMTCAGFRLWGPCTTTASCTCQRRCAANLPTEASQLPAQCFSPGWIPARSVQAKCKPAGGCDSTVGVLQQVPGGPQDPKLTEATDNCAGTSASIAHQRTPCYQQPDGQT